MTWNVSIIFQIEPLSWTYAFTMHVHICIWHKCGPVLDRLLTNCSLQTSKEHTWLYISICAIVCKLIFASLWCNCINLTNSVKNMCGLYFTPKSKVREKYINICYLMKIKHCTKIKHSIFRTNKIFAHLYTKFSINIKQCKKKQKNNNKYIFHIMVVGSALC